MRRITGTAGAAALLAIALTGCTGGSEGDSSDDAKPDGQSTAAPEPGKYESLPEPCSALDQGALDSLLPGLRSIAEPMQREKAYAGTPAATYDTDRRVGCSWKSETPTSSRRLTVDFERVVSYDADVSDDDRAEEVYGRKAETAGVPLDEPTDPESSAEDSASPDSEQSSAGEGEGKKKPDSDDAADKADSDGKADGKADGKPGSADPDIRDKASASPGPDDSAGTGKPAEPGDGTAGPGGPEGEGEGVTPAEKLPRALDDLGDDAYLDDQPRGMSSGEDEKPREREVTVVFRTSNVVVTITYDAQSVGTRSGPDGADMQDRARELARRLAGKIGD